jgi:molecular chaperone DnaJ
MDYYAILVVSRTATLEEIRKSYKELSRKFHPDRNPGDKSAEDKFKEVQNAYEILGDPVKKSEYDQHGHISRQRPADPTQHDNYAQSASRRYKAAQAELDAIQQQFFGGGELQGKNILIHLLLTPEELRSGTVKPIKWKKSEKCKTCDGYGAAIYTKSTFVKCKACAATGNMMQIPGKSGAMYPKCEICDGSGFLDMFCKTCKGTGFSEMVIEEMMVQIPAGTPSGFQLIMRGRGELAKGGIAGNLHVVVIEQARS